MIFYGYKTWFQCLGTSCKMACSEFQGIILLHLPRHDYITILQVQIQDLQAQGSFSRCFHFFVFQVKRVSTTKSFSGSKADNQLFRNQKLDMTEQPVQRPSLIHCKNYLKVVHLSSNGNLNLNTGLDVDDDLLDGLGGGEQAVTGSVNVHHDDQYSARRSRTP